MRFILFLLMTFTAVFSEGQTSKTKQPVLGTEVMYGKTTKQNGKWILLRGPSGKHFKAYAAGPANSRIGILFVHDFFGLSSAAKKSVEYLGALGYRVVAIDLYNGKVAGNDEAATELMKGKDSAITMQILRAGVAYLNRSKRKLACLGFSAGGIDAMRATLMTPTLFKATAIAYGGGYDELPGTEVEKLRTPILAITGALDKWAYEAAINFLKLYPGKSMELHVFSGVDHGYAQPLFNGGKNYDSLTTQKTWQLILQFFKDHVK